MAKAKAKSKVPPKASRAPARAKARPKASKAPNSPWLVDVDVYLVDATDPDNPRFYLDTYLPIDRDHPDQVITFHNRGRPGFDIKFNLIDETNSGYRFPPNEKRDEALWSREGEGCPPDDYNRQWEEFEVSRVIPPDRKSLVVHNKNETQTKFGYTLLVTNDDGKSYVKLDPGGDNQNGPRPLTR